MHATATACTVEGCTATKPFAKGLCQRHYQRQRWASMPECSAEGCTTPAHSRGVCLKHYGQRRAKRTRKPRPLALDEHGVTEAEDGTLTKTCGDCGNPFEVTRRSYAAAKRCEPCRTAIANRRAAAPWHRIQLRDWRHRERSQHDDPPIPHHLQRILGEATSCPLCGATLTEEAGPAQAQIDHIVPLEHGGHHRESNVRVICRTCNRERQGVRSREW